MFCIDDAADDDDDDAIRVTHNISCHIYVGTVRIPQVNDIFFFV